MHVANLRYAPGGIVYHVLNRGVGRRTLFDKDGDYLAFEKVLGETLRTRPMRMCAYCLLSNHWHFVLWPEHDGDLAAFMQQMTNTHVKRWKEHRHEIGYGHLYQERYKSFPVETEEYFYQVVRYVERNALRANLVTVCGVVALVEPRTRGTRRPGISDPFLVAAGAAGGLVADRQSAADGGRIEGVASVRTARMPFGQLGLGRADGKALGLESTLRAWTTEKGGDVGTQRHKLSILSIYPVFGDCDLFFSVNPSARVDSGIRLEAVAHEWNLARQRTCRGTRRT